MSTRRRRYKGAVSYQPTDASAAVVLAVQASRALAAAGLGIPAARPAAGL